MLERLKGKIVRYVGITRENGLIFLVKKVFRDRVYKTQDVVILLRPLNLKTRKFTRRSILTKIVALDEQIDIDGLIPHFKDKIQHFKRLREEGPILIAAYEHKTIIAYFWISPTSYNDKYVYKHFFKVADKQAYQFAGYIAVEYRGTSIVSETQRVGWEYLLARGYEEVIAAVETDNIISIKTHFHFGFREFGKILHVRKLLFYSWSRLETYEGERFSQYKKKKKHLLR